MWKNLRCCNPSVLKNDATFYSSPDLYAFNDTSRSSVQLWTSMFHAQNIDWPAGLITFTVDQPGKKTRWVNYVPGTPDGLVWGNKIPTNSDHSTILPLCILFRNLCSPRSCEGSIFDFSTSTTQEKNILKLSYFTLNQGCIIKWVILDALQRAENVVT